MTAPRGQGGPGVSPAWRASRRVLLLFLALAAPVAAPAQAPFEGEPPRAYGGFALGVGRGVASVQGASLEFGGGPAAVAMAARIGLVVAPSFLLGLHLDIAGAGSGRIVVLAGCVPAASCPATTTHRVAVNHWSAVGSWLVGGDVVLRAGGGLAESFTEDWDSPGAAVRRSFGPGVVAGVAWVPAVSGSTRISINLDGLIGWYGSRTSRVAMLTAGVEIL